MRKRFGILKVTVGILAVFLVLLAIWPKKKIAVETVQLKQGDVEDLNTPLSNAVIQAERYARIKAMSTGMIQKVYVQKGDRVKGGDLILELQNQEERARMQLAEANLAAGLATLEQTRIKRASSQKDLDRAQELLDANLLSRANFDQARTEVDVIAQSVNVQESNLKQLAAQLSIARSVYEKSFYRAPFNGVIAEILVQGGEYLVLGVPVYDIYDDSSVYVTARFDETDAARLSPGMAARVNAEALGKELHGVIESVAPVVDTDLKAGRGVDVKFSLKSDEPDIRIGMSVDIEVILDVKKDVAYLPTTVIQGSEGGRFVLVVSKRNRVEKRPITTGISNWDRTEIVSGVDANDRVISSVNLPDLKEGARVTVKS